MGTTYLCRILVGQEAVLGQNFSNILEKETKQPEDHLDLVSTFPH